MPPIPNGVPESFYLALSGVAGFVFRRNIITVFMCIELMLNAVNLSFVTFANQHKQVSGHLFTFFVMVVTTAEAAVGLAIIRAGGGGRGARGGGGGGTREN